MKKLLFLTMCLSASLFAQTTTSTSTPGSSKVNTMPGSSPSISQPSKTTPPAPAKAPKEEGPLIKIPAKISAPTEVNYLSPGVITYRGSVWAGSDNLLNVPKNIAVHIELVLPVGKQSPILEATIKKHIVDQFTKAGLSDQVQAYTNKPPLPFFHVLVMVQNIEKGYVAYIGARLFEQVEVPRVVLPDTAYFQAITWEKQDLIVASPEDISNQVLSTLDDIVQSFTERHTFFENIKKDLNK